MSSRLAGLLERAACRSPDVLSLRNRFDPALDALDAGMRIAGRAADVKWNARQVEP